MSFYETLQLKIGSYGITTIRSEKWCIRKKISSNKYIDCSKNL